MPPRNHGRIAIGVLSVVCSLALAIQAGPAQAASAASPPAVGSLSQSGLLELSQYIGSHEGQYAGIYLDSTTNHAYVLAAGAQPTAQTLENLVPAAAAQSATPGWQLEVVPAKYSASQLDAVMDQVPESTVLTAALKTAGSSLATWGVDPRSDSVLVGVTKSTPAIVKTVAQLYGAMAQVVVQPLLQSTVLRTPVSETEQQFDAQQADLATSYVASAVRPSVVLPAGSRSADSAPWYGGDKITSYQTIGGQSYIIGCTANFTFSSATSIAAAGHCGPTGTEWYNNGVYIGKTYTTQWGNGRIDGSMINGSTYSYDFWAGNTVASIAGPDAILDGETICADGSITGLNCTGIVGQTNFCGDETDNGTTYSVCHLDYAYSGSRLTQPGDSGGPVYWNYNGNKYAVGLISGENSSAGTGLWFSDMDNLVSIFGQSPS